MNWNRVKQQLEEIIEKQVDDGQNNPRYPSKIGNYIVMAATLAKHAIEEAWPSALSQESLKPILSALSKLRWSLEEYDIEDDGYAVSTVGCIMESIRGLNLQLFGSDSVSKLESLEKELLRFRVMDIVLEHCSGDMNEEQRQAIALTVALAHTAVEQSFDLAIEHQTLLPILLSFSRIRAQFQPEGPREFAEVPRKILRRIISDLVDLQREFGEASTCTFQDLCNMRFPSGDATDYRAVVENNMEEIIQTAKNYGASGIKLVWASKPSTPEDFSLLKIPDQFSNIGGPRAKFTAYGQIKGREQRNNCIEAITLVLKFPINIEFVGP